VHTGFCCVKFDAERVLGRLRLRWEENKMDLEEIGFGGGWSRMGLH
jgi:hypothetical protein